MTKSSPKSSPKSSQTSGAGGLGSLQTAYGPSNFTPKSNGGNTNGGNYPPASIGPAETGIHPNTPTPSDAANLGLGYGGAAGDQAERQFRQGFNLSSQFAGGQNDPWSNANWTRNTQSLNATLAQQAQDTLSRARDAALSKMQFRQQRRETEATTGATRAAAAAQAAAQVEAARTTAAATIEAAKQQALASRMNAQTSLFGSLISPMVSGIINVGDIKSNY
jgi:hypothetical protein